MPLPEPLANGGRPGLPVRPEIAGGGFTARFAPDFGGRMLSLAHAAAGDLLAPLDPNLEFQPLNWPRGGAYPLFPFHNRLVNGAFSFGGQHYRLPANPKLDKDVMHGPGHHRPWAVADHAPDRVSLVLDWQPDPDWPFAFRAEQLFVLSDRGLDITLRLTNTGDVPMPGGLGWHPYFALPLSGEAWTDAGLESPLDALSLPDGSPAQPRARGPLPQTTGWTRHMQAWTQTRHSPVPGHVLTIRASGLPHLAVHRMDSYICFEPVSHRAGALALPEAEWAAAGLSLLPPGTAIEGHISLALTQSQE